jgi:UDP-glucuronate 4-epimerase
MKKKIYLVTGCAGFIGFHVAKKILKSKKNIVVGIDNFTEYYSKNLKLDRLTILKKNKNFKFYNIDLSNKKKLELVFKKFKFLSILHIAAQAGVLYSYKNPLSYYKNNIIATKNIVDFIKKYQKLKKFIFCSSSSVYGDQERFPITENFFLKPKNYYALTKKKSEEYIKKNLLKNKCADNFLIFRLFTVYGPFGRPDMFILKNLYNIYNRKVIKLYNLGNHYRDFTYIDDVVNIFLIFLNKKIYVKNNIINLSGSRTIKIIRLVKLFQKFLKIKFEYILEKKRRGEVFKTYGSNKKLIKYFDYKKFTSIEQGLKKTIKWFIKYPNKNNLNINIKGI